MKTLECRICKKQFKVSDWRVGRAKYCSYACSHKGKATKKSYDKERKCKYCGKLYFPTQWYQKSCSRECFCKGIKKTGIVQCANCKKEFRQVRLAQKYCSRECGKPYQDKSLKKPKLETLDILWSKVVKRLAGDKCEYCGKANGLNSHHIFSRSNHSVRWELKNGICLCVSHHVFGLFSAHKSPIEFVEWIKEKRGVEWYEDIRVRAKQIVLVNENFRELCRQRIQQKIDELKKGAE